MVNGHTLTQVQAALASYPVLSHKVTEAWQAFYKDLAKQFNLESLLEHGKGKSDCFPHLLYI